MVRENANMGIMGIIGIMGRIGENAPYV